jgi:hypothetical protein
LFKQSPYWPQYVMLPTVDTSQTGADGLLQPEFRQAGLVGCDAPAHSFFPSPSMSAQYGATIPQSNSS